jgi:tellurite resistance protein
MASPEEQEAFIKKAAPGAQRGFREFGVPASVTIAQAIQESAWGTAPAGKANNYFGIKAHVVNGKPDFGTIAIGAVDLRTGEDTGSGMVTITSAFRKYRTMADSFRDHGKFLRENSRYKPCFRFNHDPNEFARQLQKAGYATDRNYAANLIALMKGHDLYRFDRGVHPGSTKPRPTPEPKDKVETKPTPKPKPKPAEARARLFVAGLQRDLNTQLAELGSSRRLAVDGRWDPDTGQAFEQICRIHGIEPERSVRTFRLIAGLTEQRTPEELARAAKEGARFAQRLTRRFASTRGVGVRTVGGKNLPDKQRGAAFIAALQRDLNSHLRRLGSPRVLAVDGVWDPHTDRVFHQITAILGLPPTRDTSTFRLIGAAAPRTLNGIARPTKAGAELETRLKTEFAAARTAGPTIVVGGRSLPGKELARAYIAGLQRDLNTQLKWLGATQRLKVDGTWDPATNRTFRRVCTILGIEPKRNVHTFRKIAGATAQRSEAELARAAQDGAAFKQQLRSFFALEPAVVVTQAEHPGAAHDNSTKDTTKPEQGARTFRVREPAMKGDDVLALQRVLNERSKRWKINLRIDEDREYGPETRKAVRRIAHGLGIAKAEYAHGVTPELRRKIRDPPSAAAAGCALSAGGSGAARPSSRSRSRAGRWASTSRAARTAARRSTPGRGRRAWRSATSGAASS